MTSDFSGQSGLRLHLGCGTDLIEGFVNCDIQDIEGVDEVMDCGNLLRFGNNSVKSIFGHSFFEHLYLYQQVPFLKGCKRILDDSGVLVLLGIPDFEKICRCYLSGVPAQPVFGKHFDLYGAYRLTHGDFEDGEKASIPQMHKTIFDKEGLGVLFPFCGFKNTRIFNYCSPGEDQKIGIGVIATNGAILTRNEMNITLSEFRHYFDDLGDVIESL